MSSFRLHDGQAKGPDASSETTRSYTFDGVNDVATVANTTALSFGNGTTDTPFTIEMWVRPDSVMGQRQLIGKSGEYRVAFVYGTALVQLLDRTAGFGANVTVTTTDISGVVGGWHHLAFTYDGRGGPTAGNGIAIYLDGASMPLLRDTASGYVAMGHKTSAVNIGGDTDIGTNYVGGLDELRVWNVVRTPAEILSTMSTELTGGEAGLSAYWRFNEGSGTSVADDSINNFVATLVNGVLRVAGGPF